MSALVLDAPPQGWWDRFRRGLAAPVPTAAPVWVRWERARSLGAPDDAVDPELGLLRGAELLPRRERVAAVLDGAQEVLGQAGDAVSERDFELLVADADGVVVHARGGGAFAPVARELRLIEGASWGEAVRGTNAIGTALAERRATAIVGGAHYVRGFQDLVCYAAPIRDLDGNILAVLDASSLVGRAEPAVAAIIGAVALAIEATWRARAWAKAGAQAASLVERTLDRVSEPALLVEAPGRVVRMNPAARVALAPLTPRAGVEAVLGLSWSALRAAALGAGNASCVLPRFEEAPVGRMRAAGRPGGVRARLEPLLSPDGELLAVAVFVLPTPVFRADAVRPAPADDAFANIYAEDPAIRAAVELGRRVARSDLPTVVLAETGSGKERFAEALHAASPRRDGPFVAVNCGSFAPDLLAAELFGYGPGAFTGAERGGRDGLLHAASGGTLFLDEVAEMPPAVQVALLRVLEDGRYERVGERVPRRADVRVLCATCRDLPALVASGAFRSDLWFRLKGVVLRLPSLRARTDKLGLARFLLARACDPAPDLSPALAAWIERAPWPGNVRELRSVLDVARVLADGAPVLDIEHLPPDLLDVPSAPAPSDSLAGVELAAIRQALEAAEGNVSAAARRLGVARSTVYRALQRPR